MATARGLEFAVFFLVSCAALAAARKFTSETSRSVKSSLFPPSFPDKLPQSW
jgi:hypothetical protein